MIWIPLWFASVLIPDLAFAIPVPETGVTVTFSRASDELSAMNQNSLREMMAGLGQDDRVEIVALPVQRGRTSERLARQRADQVSRFLMKEGLSAERIQVRLLSAPSKSWLKSDRREWMKSSTVEVQIIRSIGSAGELF